MCSCKFWLSAVGAAEPAESLTGKVGGRGCALFLSGFKFPAGFDTKRPALERYLELIIIKRVDGLAKTMMPGT